MRTIPELSSEAKLFYQKLLTVEKRGIITYTDLSVAIGAGKDARNHRGALYTARRMAMADGIVFATIMGVGLKRLVSAEIPDLTMHCQRRIYKQARGNTKILRCVVVSELNNEEREKYAAYATISAVWEEVAKPKRLLQLETAIKVTGLQLPVEKTLALFATT